MKVSTLLLVLALAPPTVVRVHGDAHPAKTLIGHAVGGELWGIRTLRVVSSPATVTKLAWEVKGKADISICCVRPFPPSI